MVLNKHHLEQSFLSFQENKVKDADNKAKGEGGSEYSDNPGSSIQRDIHLQILKVGVQVRSSL